MMGILLNGYDLKKGFCLKRNFIYIEIGETALKNAYPINRKQHQNDAMRAVYNALLSE
ncbi:hypothetical protein TH0225_10440 [Helicobacter pylori]